MSLPQTRSTTTFSPGSSLTIARNPETTLITRHPRTLPIRVAEKRSKALLTALSVTDPAPHSTRLYYPIVLLLTLLTLLPLALHILHANALITTLTHPAAALLCLAVLHLFYTLPHVSYLALTESCLVHRPRGLLTQTAVYPLPAIRRFLVRGQSIVARSVIREVRLRAPDAETASAGAQALNDALGPNEHVLLEDGEELVVGEEPLTEVTYQERLRVEGLSDRVIVSTLPPRFPRDVLLVASFLATHVLTSMLLLFVFDDMPLRLRPVAPSTTSAIAIAGVYLIILVTRLSWYGISSIPRRWRLVVAGYRKDVQSGMIDVGRCRDVVLSRKKGLFRVRVLSTTGNAFLDVGGLCEAEACTLLHALRRAFPALFQGAV